MVLRTFLFCVFLFAQLQSQPSRYAILTIQKEVESPASLELWEEPTGKVWPVRVGRNVLPAGNYSLRASAPPHPDLRQSFILVPGEERSILLRFLPALFSLRVLSHVTGYDLYLNHERLWSSAPGEIVLSNLPGGFQNVFLNKGRLFYNTSFKTTGKPLVTLRSPLFMDPIGLAAICGFTGLLPGVNYLIHFPKTGSGYIIPSGILFYFFSAFYAVSLSQGVQSIDGSKLVVPPGVLLVAALSTAVIHGLFSYFGARLDFAEIFEKETGKKPVW